MGRALVLQSVDFSTNKLDTITFVENIPCTSISLSQNSISFTSLTTETLTATVAPINTTDAVIWTSSDEDVATVSDGVVHATGLGTATITATCGSHSATCSVSVSVSLTNADFDDYLHKTFGKSASDIAGGKDYQNAYGDGSSTYEKYAILSGAAETSYRALTGSDADNGGYPFVIPNNAAKFEVECPSGATLTAVTTCYMASAQQPTYSISDKGTRAIFTPATTWVSNNKATITIPTDVTGFDSFILALTFSASINELPSGFKITFKDS